MADLDLQSLGMRLGEAITPTPSNAPQVRYGTVAAVNADGTLDVTIDGTTLRGVCATTGCVGAAEGMRCVVLRQGPLATVVGLIASESLKNVHLTEGIVNARWGFIGHSLNINDGAATITSYGNVSANSYNFTSGYSIGAYWTAPWTASSSSANGTVLTAKTAALTSGNYIVDAHMPTISTSSFICALNGSNQGSAFLFGQGHVTASWVVTVSEGAQLYLVSSQSAACSFSNTSRGWLRATKLS